MDDPLENQLAKQKKKRQSSLKKVIQNQKALMI